MQKIETVRLKDGLEVEVTNNYVVLSYSGGYEGVTNSYRIHHNEFREMVDWAYDQMNKFAGEKKEYLVEAVKEHKAGRVEDTRNVPSAESLAGRSAGGIEAAMKLKLGDPSKAYRAVEGLKSIEAVDLAAAANAAVIEPVVKRA